MLHQTSLSILAVLVALAVFGNVRNTAVLRLMFILSAVAGLTSVLGI